MNEVDVTWRKIVYAILLAASALLLLLMGIQSYAKQIPDEYIAHAPTVQVTELPPAAANWLLNAGDARALDELPGIGKTIAARIIQNREAYGPFYFPEDMMEVKGIGEKTFAGIMTWLEAHPEKAFMPIME